MKRAALFYWLLAIVIVVAAIVTAFYFDASVAQFMANHQTLAMRSFMRNVSRFGDWWSHFLVGLVCAGIAWWRGNKKWTRIFLAMLIALSIAGIAGRVIKVSTGRARPSVKIEQGWNGPRFSDSKYHSFPSGHVDASIGFFGVLLLARRRVGLAFLPIPILIGFSRLYLGAHWLSDVVCAMLLGIVSALAVWQFFLRRSLITDH
ncbi:MAG TPA: phosphatase PAP2 family protein [Chthoniobacterales bacterium]|nr:phosphatase PAP2 family protein [Chthoniobacterales bacterium]